MTIQEVKSMTIGMTKDGIPCLCKQTRSGKVRIIRIITAEESAAICLLLFSLHQKVKPDEKIMFLKYGKDKVLAVSEIDTHTEQISECDNVNQ